MNKRAAHLKWYVSIVSEGQRSRSQVMEEIPGVVAQLGERCVRNAEAEGSIPFDSTMLNLLWIGIAGGLGSIARYLISGTAVQWLGNSYAHGTLIVNVLGSFLMGFLVEFSTSSSFISPTFRLIIATGFLGGFTTYSSFNQETIQHLQSGDYPKAFLYIMMTLVFCLIAGYLGWGLARKITG